MAKEPSMGLIFISFGNSSPVFETGEELPSVAERENLEGEKEKPQRHKENKGVTVVSKPQVALLCVLCVFVVFFSSP
jgi:hypothetical protein